MSNKIRVGRWQDKLANIECDALITDPPYGQRTHIGQSKLRDELGYAAWTPEHVQEFVKFWAPRTAGWMVCFTSHDLISVYEKAYRDAGRYAFSPVVILQKVPRLAGDGPSNWARYVMRSYPENHVHEEGEAVEQDLVTFVMASRPRTKEAMRWRALPGAYTAPCQRGAPIRGAKPVSLMRQLVSDYSLPDDLICDPCAGWGSTRLAAIELGRRFIGSEVSRAVAESAMQREAAPEPDED
jgi:hypothetical protein